MQINIQFNKKPPKKDRAGLFNYLGKTATALSVPLFIYGLSLPTEDAPTQQADTKASSATSYFSNKLLGTYSMIGCVLLASAGLLSHRKYVLEKNLEQQYVTDDKNLKMIDDLIKQDKDYLIPMDSYLDVMAEAGYPVQLPTLDGFRRISTLLFLTDKEIYDLSPYTKCAAYIAQITCMNHFIAKATGDKTIQPTYHPILPIAEKPRDGKFLYYYQDMLDVLRSDHADARRRLAEMSSGLHFDITEDINQDGIKKAVNEKVETNGWGTAALTAIVPFIPASYSIVSATFNNFIFKPRKFEDYGQHRVVIDAIEHQARTICGLRSEQSISSEWNNYRPLSAKLTARPPSDLKHYLTIT